MLKDWEKFGVLEFDCEEPRVAPLYKNCKPENAFCLIWHFLQLISSVALAAHERYKSKRRV